MQRSLGRSGIVSDLISAISAESRDPRESINSWYVQSMAGVIQYTEELFNTAACKQEKLTETKIWEENIVYSSKSGKVFIFNI